MASSTATARMSAGTERRLGDAVAAVADLTDEGMSPTDAVVKVATAYGLLPDQIALVSTAYNTAAQAATRKAAGVLERAAPVPLADTVAAVRRSSAGGYKTAATSSVRPQFVGPPARTSGSPRVDASASVTLVPTTKAAGTTEPPVLLYKRAVAAAEEFRHRAERAYSRLTDKIADLAGYFRHNPRVGFDDALVESVLRHGKAARDLFAATQNMYPEVAAAEGSGTAYVRFDHPPHSIVTECMKLASECVDLGDQSGQLQAEADQLRPVEYTGSEVLRPVKSAGLTPTPTPTPDRGKGSGVKSPDGKNLDKPSDPPPSGAPSLGETYSKWMSWPSRLNAPVPPPTPAAVEEAQRKAIKALVDPYALAQQRGVDAQMMLTDLMATDPVIAQHPQSKIIAHYNEMSQLAPQLMTQPAAVRAMLRQRLESGAGGIDPFQIEQLLKSENALRDRDNPARGKGVLDL